MMHQPANYLAKREAHELVAEFWHELPSGSYPDDLQFSIELYLNGFVSHCLDRRIRGSKMLQLAQERARIIYTVHFWQLSHTLEDSMRQRERIEQALLATANAPADVFFNAWCWHTARQGAVLYNSSYRN